MPHLLLRLRPKAPVHSHGQAPVTEKVLYHCHVNAVQVKIAATHDRPSIRA